ncbi:hypothetical protein WME97_07365 [Sorangium sp. So ce367]|uniref:hypothetical protein n=1 Tax=Sorangium sp. So ce367 TaxID=3133305 RepID=UPI003F5FEFB5
MGGTRGERTGEAALSGARRRVASQVGAAGLVASQLLACPSSPERDRITVEQAPPAPAAAPLASPARPPAPPEPLASALPKVEATSAPSAEPGAAPPRRGSRIGGDGRIEIEQGGSVRRLEGPCQSTYEVADPMPGPYAEVLDPDAKAPRLILDSCGAGGTYFDIVATGLKLPGELEVIRVRFLDPKTGSEWTSDTAKLRVTEFTSVGAPVKGTFEATMSARLNRPAERIRGTFSLPRAPDRYPP